jgi:hypothetical protein
MRRAAIIDLKHYYSRAVVEGDFIDAGEDGRAYLIPADIDQLLFDLFRVVETFDSSVIVDAEQQSAAAGVGHSDYFGGYFFRIDESDFEFDVRIFAAANQIQQISPVERAPVPPRDFLLE